MLCATSESLPVRKDYADKINVSISGRVSPIQTSPKKCFLIPHLVDDIFTAEKERGRSVFVRKNASTRELTAPIRVEGE